MEEMKKISEALKQDKIFSGCYGEINCDLLIKDINLAMNFKKLPDQEDQIIKSLLTVMDITSAKKCYKESLKKYDKSKQEEEKLLLKVKVQQLETILFYFKEFRMKKIKKILFSKICVGEDYNDSNWRDVTPGQLKEI